MGKVGIITHFHNSINYGGVLQAYALCRVIRELGISAEQICYTPGVPDEYTERKPFLKRAMKLFNPAILKDYAMSKVEAAHNASIAAKLSYRRESFQRFGKDFVPQSLYAYTEQTILQTEKEYTCFVAGSDQVWNLNWYQGAYFLDFLREGSVKLSYAASLGMRQLTEGQQETFRRLLADFTAISVREEDAVNLISPLAPVPVECVLDPTLLLSAEEWNEICPKRCIQEPYLFCYFLSDNREIRKLAEQYAHRHGLKIVTIPHAAGRYTKGDRHFGDEKIWDASPADFLSLIKHAECIFTNSFHATVLSGIYEKQYFVFPRHKGDQMVSRIYTLTGYFGSQGHFCDCEEKCSLEYVENLPQIRYGQPLDVLIKQKEESIAFLKKNLSLKYGREDSCPELQN